MPGEALRYRVLTPGGEVAAGEAASVVLRGAEGDFAVLPGHMPAAFVLSPGQLRAFGGQGEAESLFVMGGIARVAGDTLTVLSEMAGGQEEVAAALERLEGLREERRAEEQRSGLDIQRAEVALRNALVQMDVSSYSVLAERLEGENNDAEG